MRPGRAIHHGLKRRWNLENVVEQERLNVAEDRALDWVTNRLQDLPKWEVTAAVGGKVGLLQLSRLHYQP